MIELQLFAAIETTPVAFNSEKKQDVLLNEFFFKFFLKFFGFLYAIIVVRTFYALCAATGFYLLGCIYFTSVECNILVYCIRIFLRKGFVSPESKKINYKFKPCTREVSNAKANLDRFCVENAMQDDNSLVRVEKETSIFRY